MQIPLFDLTLQHQKLQDQFRKVFDQILAHNKFILGPEVEAFEKDVARMCQAKHAISCANGSDALLLALMAYDIGPGDEIITSSFSFFATASCIARTGARAIFADILLSDYNLDPAEVLKKITPKTKAIIPVHIFGQSADMDPYLSKARGQGIRIVEDTAQAIGAQYKGKFVGSLGNVGTLSFYPTKNLGGLGDGGMLLTNDDELAEKLRMLRVHGMKPRYYHSLLGMNSRMDTLQAALLHVKLPHLKEWAEARNQIAKHYIQALTDCGLADKSLILPAIRQSNHVFHQFVFRTKNPKARDPLQKHLAAAGIGTEIYYPVPLHLQKCFASWGYKAGDLPNTELACSSTLALPIFPELTKAQLDEVIKAIRTFSWNSYEK